MARTLHLLIDLPPDARYHAATIDALDHAIDASGHEIAVRVVRTPEIDQAFVDDPGDGVFIGPGTPYERPELAEQVITSARERGIPLVAT